MADFPKRLTSQLTSGFILNKFWIIFRCSRSNKPENVESVVAILADKFCLKRYVLKGAAWES